MRMRTPPPRPPAPRGAYTLVEVLAVTVMLGLLAGLGAPPLLRAIAGDPLVRAADHLAQAFRDARSQAYGHRLRLELEASGFIAMITVDGVRSRLPDTRVPESIQLSWSRDGRPARLLECDARGHSLDTDVVLQQDARELRYAINGLTGAWVRRTTP